MACLILHYIPMRIILLAWGLIKFSKRLIRPHVVPNNEVLDLLSRVPDDDAMVSLLNNLLILFKIIILNFFQDYVP